MNGRKNEGKNVRNQISNNNLFKSRNQIIKADSARRTIASMDETQRETSNSKFQRKNPCVKLYPPLNFGTVADQLYRSGHPIPMNYAFLDTLKLKTIIYIGDKIDNYEYYDWIKSRPHLNIVFVPLSNDFKDIDNIQIDESMNLILNILLSKDNYPILIHSNKGKHRVGVVVGLIRKSLQNWSLAGCYDEYYKYTKEKGEYDLEFIELFNPVLNINNGQLPQVTTNNINN